MWRFDKSNEIHVVYEWFLWRRPTTTSIAPKPETAAKCSLLFRLHLSSVDLSCTNFFAFSFSSRPFSFLLKTIHKTIWPFSERGAGNLLALAGFCCWLAATLECFVLEGDTMPPTSGVGSPGHSRHSEPPEPLQRVVTSFMKAPNATTRSCLS